MSLQVGDGMEKEELARYGKLCIRFRWVAALVSTLVFLTLAPHQSGHTAIRLVIAAGMLSACALGNYLYKKLFIEQGSRTVFYITLGIELIAYGVFTLLSGGVASPYLWYYFGSLMMLMALKHTVAGTVIVFVWCTASLTLSRFFLPNEMSAFYMAANICFGAVIVLGSSDVICRYVRRLSALQEKQQALNCILLHEKELNHQAIDQITDLYNTFALFAMTQPERVMAQLVDTLCRTIAPSGCALVKFGAASEIERLQSRKIPDEHAEIIARDFLAQAGCENKTAYQTGQADQIYEVQPIGAAGWLPAGVVILPVSSHDKTEIGQKNFYFELIELIFKNLDSQKQLEELIVTQEKARITDEIHDTVIQRLFGIACRLKCLEGDTGNVSDEKIKEEICALERSTEQTMKELRQTIYGKSFEGETFSSRLREYMQEMQRLSDTQLNLELDDRVEQMTSAQKIAAYRIVCEGVSNALRHGKATYTDVSIRMDESNIILKVADNGDGFKREESKPLEGNGLNNINRMVQLLAGQVSIGPDEPKGTRLMAQIPLH